MISGRFVCNRKGKGNSNSYNQDDEVKLRSFSLPNLALFYIVQLNIRPPKQSKCRLRRRAPNVCCFLLVWDGRGLTMRKQNEWFRIDVDVAECRAVTWIWTANFYSRIFSDVSSFPICLVKWLGLKDLHFVFYRIQFKLPANEWNDTMPVPVVLYVLRYILKSSGVNTQSHWNAHLDKICAWSAEIDRDREKERERAT